jgi:hypothetical protein
MNSIHIAKDDTSQVTIVGETIGKALSRFKLFPIIYQK